MHLGGRIPAAGDTVLPPEPVPLGKAIGRWEDRDVSAHFIPIPSARTLTGSNFVNESFLTTTFKTENNINNNNNNNKLRNTRSITGPWSISLPQLDPKLSEAVAQLRGLI